MQICADEFALRRLGRITQAPLVFGWALHGGVDWTPARVALTVLMLVCGHADLLRGLRRARRCIQFWTDRLGEVANAFTYGGNTMTQYPLTIFPREVLKAMTFVVPVAFVNWYPACTCWTAPDPFGCPAWPSALSPVVAAVAGGRADDARVAHRASGSYRSTGS